MPWTLAHSVRFTLPVYHKNVHVLCIEHLSGSSYEPLGSATRTPLVGTQPWGISVSNSGELR